MSIISADLENTLTVKQIVNDIANANETNKKDVIGILKKYWLKMNPIQLSFNETVNGHKIEFTINPETSIIPLAAMYEFYDEYSLNDDKITFSNEIICLGKVPLSKKDYYELTENNEIEETKLTYKFIHIPIVLSTAIKKELILFINAVNDKYKIGIKIPIQWIDKPVIAHRESKKEKTYLNIINKYKEKHKCLPSAEKVYTKLNYDPSVVEFSDSQIYWLKVNGTIGTPVTKESTIKAIKKALKRFKQFFRLSLPKQSCSTHCFHYKINTYKIHY